MPEFTFDCPSCKQAIQCDDAWSGQQIQCPICNAALIVPQNQPAPAPQREVAHLGKQLVAPPSGAGSRLSAGSTQVARSSFGAGKKFQKRAEKKKNPAVTIGIIGAVVVVLAAAVYFSWPYIKQAQEKFNARQAQAAKDSGGGEMGHIAEVVGVLDATDPSRMGDDAAPTTSGKRRRQAAEPAADSSADAGAAAQPPAATMAIVPPTWTLDVKKAQIPEGRANGSIAGTNFVVETARLDRVGASYVLTLRQGAGASPDRGAYVYLRVNPGETPTNKTFTVSEDMKGNQVTKVWKTNPKYAAQTKQFFTGYAMKLELGAMNDAGAISGKIFLALPDTEHSVVGGLFTAATTAGTPGMDATQTQAAPLEGQQTDAQRARFQQRYGIKR